MISMIALYSSWPGHRILLILNIGRSGDVDAVQQIPQSASGNRGFISKSFDLIGIVERLILLGIAPRSVVFIFFAFSLVALFFFFLILLFLPMIVVVVVVRRQLLLFCRCSLRFLSLRYHNHNLEWFILLRRVVVWLLLRWHVHWCQQTNWQMSSALPGCAASTSHLKFRNRRE
jgi:hypothetical protein